MPVPGFCRVAALGLAVAWACAADAAWVGHRWAGYDMPASFPNTLTVVDGKDSVTLRFDLSALAKGTRVAAAHLQVRSDGSQPVEPIRILAAGSDEPLKLERPLYRSFDATAAVRGAAATGVLELTVAKFDGFQPKQTYLEIIHEVVGAAPGEKPEQVGGLRAIHHDGQTFLVWKEAAAYRPTADELVWVEKFAESGNTNAKGPGIGWREQPNTPAILIKTLRRLQGLQPKSVGRGVKYVRVSTPPEVRYRVYRHGEPITAANIAAAELVGEVDPLAAYDEKMRVVSFQGEYLNQQEVETSAIPPYCIEDGKAIAPGEALFVYTPDADTRAFYAVTMVLAGTENLADVGPANSLAAPVAEKLAEPAPVFQHFQEDRYHKDVPEYWYILWAAPPYANRQDVPLHVVASMSDKIELPAMLNFDTFAGGFNMIGTINLPSRTAITLRAEQQISWFDDLAYNEGRGTLRSCRDCKVDYFSERYVLRVLQWAMGKWQVDRGRIIGGPLHFGVRHPEIFGKLSFGAYTVEYDFMWSPPGSSLARNLGPRDVARTTDGQPAWDIYNLGWYLKTYPARDIPYMVCVSATGKDSGHTSEFGWQDDPRGWRALYDARQNFIATWTSGPPPEHGQMLAAMRWDRSLPAFSRCSLDNNPGNGDPADGDPTGTINGWLLWQHDDQVDEPGRWAMTVYLADSCPNDSCTVDLTPRHVKAFKTPAGTKVQWTNTDAAGAVLQRGTATADKNGLLTIERLAVGKGPNRIALTK